MNITPGSRTSVARTRVKFCGITCSGDAQAAARLGVDAIGLVFAAGSPRFIRLDEAAMIRRRLPPFMQAVALFRNPDPELVKQVMTAVQPDMLQFHGEESAAFCESFGLPYLRAVPMKIAQDLRAWTQDFASAAALLLDGHEAGQAGGQGRAFNWTAVPAAGKPLVLAGGLTPDNVGEAIKRVRPYAVDVSSGIESAPGIKDPEKMQRFVDEVRRADAQ